MNHCKQSEILNLLYSASSSFHLEAVFFWTLNNQNNNLAIYKPSYNVLEMTPILAFQGPDVQKIFMLSS